MTAGREGRARRAVALLVLMAHAGAASSAVVLAGVDDAQRSNVLAHLRLDDEPCDAPPWRVQQAFRNAPASIEVALVALGYYTPSIQSSLELGEACWEARFEIEPGPAVTIRRLDLAVEGQADADPVFADLRATFPLLPGRRLDHGGYESWKRTVLDRARQRGYVEAAFTTARIDVYPDLAMADVRVTFASGPRYRFGPIVLEQEVLASELVLSYVDFDRGDLYDSQRLAELYVALNDSGYFSSIDVRALEPDDLTHEIPVAIGLRPGRRLLVSYGVGFSTDVGPRLRFGRTNRRVNAAGHQLGVNAQLSPVISETALSYRFPYGDPRSEWISFTAGLKREDTESALSNSAEFGARRIFRLARDWTFSQSLSYLTEDFEVAEQTGRSRLLMPGLLWSRLRADSPVRPDRGSRVDLELRGASDTLGSDTSFVQAVASAKWIWSRTGSARWLVRGAFGLTGKSEFSELPPSVRFFAGGDASVRGYKFKSLGPLDDEGQVVGGSGLLVGSVEHERAVTARWSIAAFVDAGNAFDGTDFEPETGVGFGVRWRSPVGPIRLDIGWPVSAADDGPRLHVSLGPDL